MTKPTVHAAFAPKFQGAAAIEKAIASIHTRGKKLDGDIQACGISVLAHIDSCGDITLFERLYAAMPAGSRRNALVDWATTYGKLAVNLDDATKKAKPFLHVKGKATDMEGALAKPWYECKPEKDLDKEFDFVAKLESLIAQAQKAEAAGKPVKGLERLHAIVGAKPATVQPTPMALPDEVVEA